MFFAISTFFELVCLLLYTFIFPKLPIVKYYRSKAASEGSKTVSADLAAGGVELQPGQVRIRPHLIKTIKKLTIKANQILPSPDFYAG